MSLFSAPIAGADAAFTDKAVLFVVNAHTGVPMRASRWLSDSTVSASQFRMHGGLAALTKQSTALAHQYGGLKAVEVVEVNIAEKSPYVAIRVSFQDDARRKSSPAIAEREEMIWRFRGMMRNNNWALTLE
jgi:hypothetical protein